MLLPLGTRLRLTATDAESRAHPTEVGHLEALTNAWKHKMLIAVIIVGIISAWAWEHPAPAELPPAPTKHLVIHANEWPWEVITNACPKGTNVGKIVYDYHIPSSVMPETKIKFSCADGD
jgi:hypothetical protein